MFPKFIQVSLYSDGGEGGGGVAYIQGAYIQDLNWVTYLGDVYSGRVLYTGGVLSRFYGISM